MTDRKPRRANLSAARLAAVQALYDAELSGADTDTLIADFIEHGLGAKTLLSDGDDTEREFSLAAPDAGLFSRIVGGTLPRTAELDGLIGGALEGSWTVERLEAVLQAILRAAAFELSVCPDVPCRVTISEYVAVAGAFYSGPEPGLVNAILDRISRAVRPDEFETAVG
jgi:N utilization substance protein B